MAIVARIQEISRAEHGLIYVVVHVWGDQAAFDAGNPPRLVEDFLMQIQATEQRPLVDAATGWPLLQNGTPQNPADKLRGTAYRYRMETINVDVHAVINANIRAYLARAAGRGDIGDRRVQPDRTRTLDDPDGVLARAADLLNSDPSAI